MYDVTITIMILKSKMHNFYPNYAANCVDDLSSESTDYESLSSGSDEGSTGSISFFSCPEGFTLFGSRVRQCLPSSRWSESHPVCEPMGMKPNWLNLID